MQRIVITLISFFLGTILYWSAKNENEKETDRVLRFSNYTVMGMGWIFYIYGIFVQIDALFLSD